MCSLGANTNIPNSLKLRRCTLEPLSFLGALWGRSRNGVSRPFSSPRSAWGRSFGSLVPSISIRVVPASPTGASCIVAARHPWESSLHGQHREREQNQPNLLSGYYLILFPTWAVHHGTIMRRPGTFKLWSGFSSFRPVRAGVDFHLHLERCL